MSLVISSLRNDQESSFANLLSVWVRKFMGIKQRRTTYTLRLLPIGGYVRMAGNGDDETEMAPGMPLSLY